jgi:hypothetical protein
MGHSRRLKIISNIIKISQIRQIFHPLSARPATPALLLLVMGTSQLQTHKKLLP